jgi:hypothetical protein
VALTLMSSRHCSNADNGLIKWSRCQLTTAWVACPSAAFGLLPTDMSIVLLIVMFVAIRSSSIRYARMGCSFNSLGPARCC